jgi:cytochrome d ubiquinol oxidase subunit II
VLIGLLAVAALTAHGANFIVVKTDGLLHRRAQRISRRAWLTVVVLTALGTLATFSVRPEMLGHLNERPWGYILPALALGGLAGMGYFTARAGERAAFVSSSAYILGMLASTAFALYPDMLPAVVPGRSLTVYNAAATHYELSVGLVWWSIGIVLAVIYFVLTYRLFRGKVEMQAGGGYGEAGARAR